MRETFTYEVSEERALATLRAVFASPINFADTAASYGDGESERRVGMVLCELGGIPPGFVLATKADRSLRLLGLDQLPICFLHDPEHIGFAAAMAPGGPVEMLRQCQEEGLIHSIGIAGGPIDMMTRFVETNLFTVAISHNRYTLLNQEAAPFWDVCVQRHVGALNAAPYGSGILAKGPGAYPRYMYDQASEHYVQYAFKIEAVCRRYGVPLAAAALQFSLRDPRIVSTIVGVSRPERLEETVALAELSIPDDLWQDIALLEGEQLRA